MKVFSISLTNSFPLCLKYPFSYTTTHTHPFSKPYSPFPLGSPGKGYFIPTICRKSVMTKLFVYFQAWCYVLQRLSEECEGTSG